jgi:hypothetical protein
MSSTKLNPDMPRGVRRGSMHPDMAHLPLVIMIKYSDGVLASGSAFLAAGSGLLLQLFYCG